MYTHTHTCLRTHNRHYGDRDGVEVADCVGKCTAGYYCVSGSSDPQDKECGSVSMFCPAGSIAPVPVPLSHYATPPGCTTKCSGEQKAVTDFFAVAGRQFACPKLNSSDTFEVLEFVPAGTRIQGLAWPATSAMPAATFSLVGASADFAVDASTGMLSTTRELRFNDYTGPISVVVNVQTVATFPGLGGNPYFDKCTLRIKVVDENQVPTVNDVTFEVKENAAKGTVVNTVTATDTDTDRFTFQIVTVKPSAWAGAITFASPTEGKLVVSDTSLLDFEALAGDNFQIVLTVSVADNHPTDPKKATATVTINLLDVDDLVLGADTLSKADGGTTESNEALRTGGGDDVCFGGSGFSSLSGIKVGAAWGIIATYRNAEDGASYTATQCRVFSLTRVCCKSVAGVGATHSWTFKFTLPAEVSGDALATSKRLLGTMTEVAAKVTSYGAPAITSLLNADDMRTSGGETVEVQGMNLGPVGTVGLATYESQTGDLVVSVECGAAKDATGAFILMRCTSKEGWGGPLRWQITVGGQTSLWTSFTNAKGNPMSNYAGPQVTSITPASGPTNGGFHVVVAGTNFALRGTLQIGAYPCTIEKTNHTHIEATAGGGMGQNLPVEVKVGNLSSSDNGGGGIGGAVTFSYDPPTVDSVTVVKLGTCGASTVDSTSDSGSDLNAGSLHGCTQGSTQLRLTGRNFGPGCDTSDSGSRVATPAERACSCGVRLGKAAMCGVPVEAKGSWCDPIFWDHETILCAVKAGAGGNLAVGIVAGGDYFAEPENTVGEPVFPFNFDLPVVDRISPSTISVEGGQTVRWRCVEGVKSRRVRSVYALN